MINTDILFIKSNPYLRAFRCGVEDALVEQGMVHAEEYAQFVKIAGDGSEYLSKYYHDGYEFGEYLLHVMSLDYVEVERE